MFLICFLGFGIACLSRVAPNGVESFAFVLALISSACVVCLDWWQGSGRWRNRPVALLISPWLLLFLWYAVTIDWSSADPLVGIRLLFEYRLLVCIPLFLIALLIVDPSPEALLKPLVISGVFGTLLLYAFEIESVRSQLEWARPRGSYIISGAIGSSVFVLCVLAKDVLRWHGLIVLVIAAGVAGYVLGLDSGRTGYLQVLAVAGLAILTQARDLKARVVLVSCGVVSLYLFWIFSDSFSDRSELAVTQAMSFLRGDNAPTSAGLRLQWFAFAVDSLSSSWVLGVGLDGYKDGIQEAVNSGMLKFGTDNLHSEFSNSLYAGGFVGLILFFGCLVSWSFLIKKLSREVFLFAVGLTCVFVIGAMFNSIFKDFGEKNILMAVWPFLLFLCVKENGSRTSENA